jgi:hypothetical protein
LEKEEKEEKARGVGFHVNNYGLRNDGIKVVVL